MSAQPASDAQWRPVWAVGVAALVGLATVAMLGYFGYAVIAGAWGDGIAIDLAPVWLIGSAALAFGGGFLSRGGRPLFYFAYVTGLVGGVVGWHYLASGFTL